MPRKYLKDIAFGSYKGQNKRVECDFDQLSIALQQQTDNSHLCIKIKNLHRHATLLKGSTGLQNLRILIFLSKTIDFPALET